ncbi:MAG: hypothetical protein JWM04_2605 [Verrucomicrobiales bacterium]|nr:hypothetical protein [Verrucomicrobiales bacterium]
MGLLDHQVSGWQQLPFPQQTAGSFSPVKYLHDSESVAEIYREGLRGCGRGGHIDEAMLL